MIIRKKELKSKIEAVLLNFIQSIANILSTIFSFLENNKTPIFKLSWFDFLILGSMVIATIIPIISIIIAILKLMLFSFNYWIQ